MNIAKAALERAQRLFNEALPKFDWGKSALDANAIALLNEVPGEVARALATMSEDWQLIETARAKDGTRILAWDGKKQFICHFRGEHHQPHQDKPGWFEQHIRMRPTKWKPLGANPT